VKLIAQEGPTMEHHTLLSPRWAAVRDDLSARREARAAREILRRELASFTTTADLHELDLMLDRAEPQAADNVRSLIPRLSAV
jgi:hypothetical protein